MSLRSSLKRRDLPDSARATNNGQRAPHLCKATMRGHGTDFSLVERLGIRGSMRHSEAKWHALASHKVHIITTNRRQPCNMQYLRTMRLLLFSRPPKSGRKANPNCLLVFAHSLSALIALRNAISLWISV